MRLKRFFRVHQAQRPHSKSSGLSLQRHLRSKAGVEERGTREREEKCPTRQDLDGDAVVVEAVHLRRDGDHRTAVPEQARRAGF